LATVRKQGKIALATASSGIAALLLPGGRTAHSRFKIPINVNDCSTCNIKLQSDDANLIAKAKIIVWDEAPMIHRHCIEALSRTLQDIMKKYDPQYENLPFGGKVVVFGGDFRQILPVVIKGQRSDIIAACLNQSELWKHVQISKLTINMRIQSMAGQDATEAQHFADLLIRIGEGKEEFFNTPSLTHTYEINLPAEICRDRTYKELIEDVYPEIANRSNETDWMNSRAILTTTNKEVTNFNDTATSLFPGSFNEFLSADTIEQDNDNGSYWPTEFLNKIEISGLPPHRLVLKENMPVMLLRNICPSDGLCNGTRLTVKRFRSRVIEAEIAVGEKKGKRVYISRMPIMPSENGLAISFSRLQFPLKPCFAMTINKSQGQTLNFVGIHLKEEVFTHGQLYVALSRVSSLKNIIANINKKNPNYFRTSNVVYKEVFT